jgi:hypothetical protein
VGKAMSDNKIFEVAFDIIGCILFYKCGRYLLKNPGEIAKEIRRFLTAEDPSGHLFLFKKGYTKITVRLIAVVLILVSVVAGIKAVATILGVRLL